MFDNLCKHEMDPTSIIEDTERARFCPQTDRRTDRWMDNVKSVYLRFNFVEAGGIMIERHELDFMAKQKVYMEIWKIDPV